MNDFDDFSRLGSDFRFCDLLFSSQPDARERRLNGFLDDMFLLRASGFIRSEEKDGFLNYFQIRRGVGFATGPISIQGLSTVLTCSASVENRLILRELNMT